jgi:hypothetical protein
MDDTVESLEREVAASRARLADTLDQLTDPETSEAVKRDLMDTVHRTKDEVLNRGRQRAQGLADNLKRRARDNPVAVALIGAGIAWRLYKRPPVATLLIGAGIAGLMMSGGSGRGASRPSGGSGRTAGRDPYADPRQGYVPGGVAGYGYPVEADAPTPGRTERGGASPGVADRARMIAERAQDAAATAAARASEAARETGERVRASAAHLTEALPGVVEKVSERAADLAAQASATASGLATRASETAAHAAGRARMVVSDLVEQASEGTAGARSYAAETAHGATDRAIALLDKAQRNPVILGAVGLAAGLAIARSVRGTGAGARRVTAGAADLAEEAADRAGDLAASTRGLAADFGTAAGRTLSHATDAAAAAASTLAERGASLVVGVQSRAAEAYRSLDDAASSGRGGGRGTGGRGGARQASRSRAAADRRFRADHRSPGLGQRLERQIHHLGREYPLLLATAGLAVGAALGGLFEPTEAENRLLGDASDHLKARVRAAAGEQLEQIADAARHISEHVLHPPDAPASEAPETAEPPYAAGPSGATPTRTEGPTERAVMEAQRKGFGPV